MIKERRETEGKKGIADCRVMHRCALMLSNDTHFLLILFLGSFLDLFEKAANV